MCTHSSSPARPASGDTSDTRTTSQPAAKAATRRGRRQHGLATLAMGVLIAQGGVLGALLTFTPQSLYTAYTGAYGLTALDDQQLAGTLMWVPPGFVYAIAGITLFIRWLDLLERDARRRARLGGPTATS